MSPLLAQSGHSYLGLSGREVCPLSARADIYFPLYVPPLRRAAQSADQLLKGMGVFARVAISHTHGDHIGNVGLFPDSAIMMQRAEYSWINSPNGPNDNVNQLMALARELLGTPKNLQLIDGDTDVYGEGSVTLVSTPGHTPGHQSLLVHLKNSGFIILSGDVVHSEENFEKDRVPSLNTNKAESIASMEKIRQMIAMYKATLFINHDKKQTDKLKLLPAFYD